MICKDDFNRNDDEDCVAIKHHATIALGVIIRQRDHFDDRDDVIHFNEDNILLLARELPAVAGIPAAIVLHASDELPLLRADDYDGRLSSERLDDYRCGRDRGEP